MVQNNRFGSLSSRLLSRKYHGMLQDSKLFMAVWIAIGRMKYTYYIMNGGAVN